MALTIKCSMCEAYQYTTCGNTAATSDNQFGKLTPVGYSQIFLHNEAAQDAMIK